MIDNEYIHPIQVNWEDTDCAGVVHHPNFLNYMERARVGWLHTLGLDLGELVQQGYLFAIRRAELDYLKPARLNDKLEVVCRIERQRVTSITYQQIIRQQQDPTCILCKGLITVVCIDAKMRPQEFPTVMSEGKVNVS